MGWFLTQKSRGGQGKRGSRGAGPPHWQPEHTVLSVKIALSLAAVALAGLGWIYGKAALKDYVSNRHRSVVTTDNVKLVEVPRAWHTKGTLARLRRRVAERVSPDPLDSASLGQAVRALEADPIVRSAQVKRGQRGRIRVDASYRLPTAIIEARDGYYLVDDAGTRLSLYPYGRHQLDAGPLDRLPVIRRVDSAPPREPGQRWAGEAVQASLDLIELLRGKLNTDLFQQVEAIDATQRDSRDRLRLALITKRGRVEWGFPPGKERGIDQRPTVKLQRLRRLAKRYNGRIDADGKLVRIAGPRVKIRQLEIRNVQRR